MVDADNLMALKLENAAHGLADDGRSQMADVHFFGDVGAGEIHNDFLRLIERVLAFDGGGT